MGRHGSGKRGGIAPLTAVLAAVALAAVVGLGLWWWSLRTIDDPVAADPVSAYGTIVTSQPCTQSGATSTVSFSTASGIVTAPLQVCGFKVDQSILVDYLRSDPAQVRPADTSPASSGGTLKKWLPIGILFFGVLGAGALLAMVREQRSHHVARRNESTQSWVDIRAAELAARGASAVPADSSPLTVSTATSSDLPSATVIGTVPATPVPLSSGAVTNGSAHGDADMFDDHSTSLVTSPNSTNTTNGANG